VNNHVDKRLVLALLIIGVLLAPTSLRLAPIGVVPALWAGWYFGPRWGAVVGAPSAAVSGVFLALDPDYPVHWGVIVLRVVLSAALGWLAGRAGQRLNHREAELVEWRESLGVDEEHFDALLAIGERREEVEDEADNHPPTVAVPVRDERGELVEREEAPPFPERYIALAFAEVRDAVAASFLRNFDDPAERERHRQALEEAFKRLGAEAAQGLVAVRHEREEDGG
jgi:hypothetical protein